MKRTHYAIVLMATLFLGSSAWGADAFKWNGSFASPLAIALDQTDQITQEIYDFNATYGPQFDWPKFNQVVDPNERLKERVRACEKVLADIFQVGGLPTDLMREHICYSKVKFAETEEVLHFRLETDRYRIQFMQRKYNAYISVLPLKVQKMGIRQVAEDLFTPRLLPLEWNRSFWGAREFKGNSLMHLEHWKPIDVKWRSATGEFKGPYYDVRGKRAPLSLPIGEGRYASVQAYTNGDFVLFAIQGGPK